jgi:carbonic anhydrase/acetyltransferase-like protein (isoleucine patch superfamily)
MAAGPIILPFNGITPRIAADAFVAPGAVIIGNVEIGPQASIWFGCVVRADTNFIKIGARTNIQDGSVIHCDGPQDGHPGYPTTIGDDVLIGHMVMCHGATLENRAFIGMKAVLLNGSVVEGDAMVAAGAMVTGKRVAKGQLWAGSPAKFLRDLRPEDIAGMHAGVEHYVRNGQNFRTQLGG